MRRLPRVLVRVAVWVFGAVVLLWIVLLTAYTGLPIFAALIGLVWAATSAEEKTRSTAETIE